MSHKLSACLSGLLSILMLSSCAPWAAGDAGVPSGYTLGEDVYVLKGDVTVVEPEQPVFRPDEGMQEAPVEEVPAEEAPEEIPAYDFSLPVPAAQPVDNSYFADAAFVGDSRTDGFCLYSGVGCGENLTSNGLSMFRLKDKKVLKKGENSYTLLEALAMKEYGKVYLSLGVNELGMNNDAGFYKAYCDAIDTIRSIQPNAVIYIQGLIPLNEQVIAKTGGASYLKNERLQVYNSLMKQVAEEKQVAFLDLNPEFTDQTTGQLPEDASHDGVHLRGSYCKLWLEYLKHHTVEYDTLYPEGEVLT